MKTHLFLLGIFLLSLFCFDFYARTISEVSNAYDASENCITRQVVYDQDGHKSAKTETFVENLHILSAIKCRFKTPAEQTDFDLKETNTMKVDPRIMAYDGEKYTPEQIGLSSQDVNLVYPDLGALTETIPGFPFSNESK